MDYQKITGIDLPISRLIQGTVYFSDDDPEPVFDLFDTIFDYGCNAFDTARVYQSGGSERILGQWIRSRGYRDRVVIIGKGAHPRAGIQRVTTVSITGDLYTTLEALQTEYIDVYLLHRDDPAQPVEPIIDVLNKHHDEERISVFGVSNWTHHRIQEANDYAAKHGLIPIRASSPQFSLAEMVRPAWDGCISIGGASGVAARQWYAETGMALMVWSSLAGGFMTGKFTPDNLDTFSDYYDGVTAQAYGFPENFERLERARLLAEHKQVSLSQIALAYVLTGDLNLFALTGCKTGDEFKNNLEALDIELSAQERDWLELKSEPVPF